MLLHRITVFIYTDNQFLLSTIDLHNGDCEDQKEPTKINIEGLFSLERLHVVVSSKEMCFSMRNLNSLNMLSLLVNCAIDEAIITNISEQVPHIEQLFLRGHFSYFNLDHLVNLKVLSLVGTINESFNINLIKSLCNQLTVLKIRLTKIEDKTFFKLFDGHLFPYLVAFSIIKCNLKRIKREFIKQFPMIKTLFIIDCNLEVIEKNAFPNLEHLHCLDLSQNRLKFIEENTFSNLENLLTIDLSHNQLTNLDAEFIGVGNSTEILLENKNFDTFNRFWFKH